MIISAKLGQLDKQCFIRPCSVMIREQDFISIVNCCLLLLAPCAPSSWRILSYLDRTQLIILYDFDIDHEIVIFYDYNMIDGLELCLLPLVHISIFNYIIYWQRPTFTKLILDTTATGSLLTQIIQISRPQVWPFLSLKVVRPLLLCPAHLDLKDSYITSKVVFSFLCPLRSYF